MGSRLDNYIFFSLILQACLVFDEGLLKPIVFDIANVKDKDSVRVSPIIYFGCIARHSTLLQVSSHCLHRPGATISDP
jgi:hypothetical protein